MSLQDELLARERGFWTGGVEVYREHLAAQALMVFPSPAGVLDRSSVLASIGTAPRWSDVAIEDVRVAALTAGVALLTYRGTGTRSDATEPYVTLASSVYVREGGAWRLAFHQQTPVPARDPHAPDRLAM